MGDDPCISAIRLAVRGVRRGVVSGATRGSVVRGAKRELTCKKFECAPHYARAPIWNGKRSGHPVHCFVVLRTWCRPLVGETMAMTVRRYECCANLANGSGVSCGFGVPSVIQGGFYLFQKFFFGQAVATRNFLCAHDVR